MNIRVIKTQEDYKKALTRAHSLVMNDPELGTGEAEQLELLTVLIEDFERKAFPFDIPDPISAIEFRMEEQGLRQRDLIPILGSRSRVSEVLARKRPLTLQMIRSISDSLGISADVLVRASAPAKENSDVEPNWSKFPFQEMQKRGWIPKGNGGLGGDDVEKVVKDFLALASRTPATAFFRRNLKGLGYDGVEEKAKYSTFAWTARVLNRATECQVQNKFKLNSLSADFLREIATLSSYIDGPRLAIDRLRDIGVCVIVEPRLPSSLIDGAALLNDELQPVVGLTLRFDRVDYFWFTLLHEIAHVWKHLNSSKDGFVDRIDSDDDQERIEKEANKVARDALIPRTLWNKSAVRLNPSSSSITRFAAEIGVHPAIVAGRVRHESGTYNRFSNLLGQGSVRSLFPEVNFN